MTQVSLSCVNNLLSRFHEEGILYCHYKSNQHLLAGLCGETDLDILINRYQFNEAVELLLKSGFKRFSSKLQTSYPAIEDWIGFDNQTGALLHIHLHWQLTAGEPNLKGYRIPWEDEVVRSSILNIENNIHISSPEMEMILLIVRASLKLRKRNSLQRFFGKVYLNSESDIAREFCWLHAQIDIEKTIELCSRLLPYEIVVEMRKLLEKNNLTSINSYSLLREIFKHFQQYRTYNSCMSNLLRWYRELYPKLIKVIVKRSKLLIPFRRVPSTGGLIITFLGADGSGKSSHVKHVYRWLNWKIDVGTIYFGSGDGPVSLLRKPLVMIPKILNFRRKNSLNCGVIKNVERIMPTSFIGKVYISLWALSLAYEKKSNMQKAIRARNQGMVVLCDRFPQTTIIGFNDGPILNTWLNEKSAWGLFAQVEDSIFKQLVKIKPDLVFKLDVSEQVAKIRKNDTPVNMITKKIKAVKEINLNADHTIVLNADSPFEQVSLQVKKAIWNSL